MMISQKLLSLLVCPQTKEQLVLASKEQLEELNHLIKLRRLKSRRGRDITKKLDGGLICSSKQWIYPVRRGIPLLIVDEAIDL